MQTQQIGATIGTGFFPFNGSNASAERKVTESFETMFRSTSERYETITVQDGKAKVQDTGAMSEKTEVVTGTESQKTLSDESGNVAEMKDETKTFVTENKQAETKNVSKDEAVEEVKDADEVVLAESMAMLIMQVTETVKEVLQLTEEQLNNTMELLGITEKDMLQTDMLRQMVLVTNGEQTPSAFLTDNELLGQLKELTHAVEQLMMEHGISNEEMQLLFADTEFIVRLEKTLDLMAEEQTGHQTTPEQTIKENTEIKELEISFQSKEVVQEKTNVSSLETAEQGASERDFSQENQDALAGQFVQKLEQAFTEGVQETSLRSDLAAQIREIADQILEQVKMVVTPETTSLEIQLTPEQLGKVHVTVTEQDGLMKATFTTENELAKEAIESNLVQFKEMMNEQGLRVESIEVTVSEFSFDKNGQTSQNSQDEQKNSKTRFVTEQEADAVTMQDELALHFMEGGESTVNYMA